MRAVLKAQINKTDRNDARGIGASLRARRERPRSRAAEQCVLLARADEVIE